jgi:hypothetical protein
VSAVPEPIIRAHQEWVRQLIALDPGWELVMTGTAAEVWRRGRMRAIWSLAILDDGEPWLHVSVGTPGGPPSWGEISRARKAFIGEGRPCLQLPPGPHSLGPGEQSLAERHTLVHLWAPYWSDDWRLPDFPDKEPA